MSNTFLATIPHQLIQGSARGKYHAGISEPASEGMGATFRTACGEEFTNPIVYEVRELAIVVRDRPDAICKRCDRVGEAIADR